MKCQLKNKHCKPSLCFKTTKKNFICSGVSTKPTKYGLDTIWICGDGALCKFRMEMTKEETSYFIACLSMSLFEKVDALHTKSPKRKV